MCEGGGGGTNENKWNFVGERERKDPQQVAHEARTPTTKGKTTRNVYSTSARSAALPGIEASNFTCAKIQRKTTEGTREKTKGTRPGCSRTLNSFPSFSLFPPPTSAGSSWLLSHAQFFPFFVPLPSPVYRRFVLAALSRSIFSLLSPSSHPVDRVSPNRCLNPFTVTGYFHRQPPRWQTFLAMLFQILKEGTGLPLSDELEVQYHVIKK